MVKRADANHPRPFLRTRESRYQQAPPNPVEEQDHASLDPHYVDHKPAVLPRQQFAPDFSAGQSSGSTYSYSSNPQTDSPSYGHQNNIPGHGHGPYNHGRPGGTAAQYQPYYQPYHPHPYYQHPYYQQPYYQFSNLPSQYWPAQRPPSPLRTQPPPPPPPPPPAPPSPPLDREKLALKEELKAMKEFTERAKDADTLKQMEKKVRKEVEEKLQRQMRLAKEAEERAKEEIEKIRTEAEITTREKILAERHAEAERERLETQQATRFEREVRLKIERERVAEEQAREDRARQAEELEIQMREKMLQSMDALTSMARGKMVPGTGVEKESSSRVLDKETNDETVINKTKVKTQVEERFSNCGANEYQKGETEVKEQETYRQSSDTRDVLEQQTSTPETASQKSHYHHFGLRGINSPTGKQHFSTRKGPESRASPENPSNASMDSGATHLFYKMPAAHGDQVPPPVPDVSSMGDGDDWKSSSSGGNRPSSYMPRRSRRAYSAYGDYPMDEEQHFYPGYQYQSYQDNYRHQNHYQEHHPHQESRREYHPYPEHQSHQEYPHEDYAYPASNPNPIQMDELVEHVIDEVFSRLRVVPAPHWDHQKTQPSPHIESFPRLKNVSSASASDIQLAHSEAATLQSQLYQSTHETSISDENVSDAKLSIEGGVLLKKSNLPDGPETSKSPAPMHVDVAAVTTVAACHDEDEFHTPTDNGELTMQAYFECSTEDTDENQDMAVVQPGFKSDERPAFWRRPTLKCQSCGYLTILCKCSYVSDDTED
ncbi:hypothetical protein TGAMA5MH_05060 [Trichoderma gamsii]|uniref:Uncharacterized protein n=1 Tax=Trichoderma gamsii TaxID=398673 RepID=A0A2K0TCA1_9HYPO|nr:hypothetical protein TGAMA5MH_05060 [Trichoderma gamsii]